MTIIGTVTSINGRIWRVLDESLHYYIVVSRTPPSYAIGERVNVTGEQITLHYINEDFKYAYIDAISV